MDNESRRLYQNNLILDGYHTTILRDASIQNENIDLVATHHYSKNPQETIDQIKRNMAKARGKKHVISKRMLTDSRVNREIT